MSYILLVLYRTEISLYTKMQKRHCSFWELLIIRHNIQIIYDLIGYFCAGSIFIPVIGLSLLLFGKCLIFEDKLLSQVKTSFLRVTCYAEIVFSWFYHFINLILQIIWSWKLVPPYFSIQKHYFWINFTFVLNYVWDISP